MWDLWKLTHTFTTKCYYIGINDATRNEKGVDQKQCSQEGSVMNKSDAIKGMLQQEKYRKLKTTIH